MHGRTATSGFDPDRIGDFLEAVYCVDNDDQEWLGNVTAMAREVWGRGGPAHAFIYDASSPSSFRVQTEHTIEFFGDRIQCLRDSIALRTPKYIARSLRTLLTTSSVRTLSSPELDPFFERMAALGAPDCVGINGLDPEGKGTVVAMWMTGRCEMSPTEEAAYRRMADHLGAAHRCRRRLHEAADRACPLRPTDGAEAILDVQLRFVHAEGVARRKDAQLELLDAATARERKSAHRENSDDRAQRWRPMTLARWTLVDSYERDGKRYIVARENQSWMPGLASLTDRERQVVSYLALGQSTKETAYALGISDVTVRVLIRRAAAKLGVATCAALLAHPEVRALRLE